MWIPELKCFEKLDARKWGKNKLLNTDVKKLGKIDKVVNEYQKMLMRKDGKNVQYRKSWGKTL